MKIFMNTNFILSAVLSVVTCWPASIQAKEWLLEPEGEREAVLVLTDSYYPGWTAEVDGKAADILRADYVFRAVPLSAGRHTVVFKFRPASFLLGAAVSCLGAAAWSAWGILLILRRRR